MNDDQSTGWENQPHSSAEPAEGVSNAAQPPAPAGVSRRNVLWWVGVGALSAAALGAGAVAVYASQVTGQDATRPGARAPQGYASGMPRREQGAGAWPSGSRPSGMRPHARPTGAPTDLPSAAPSSGG